MSRIGLAIGAFALVSVAQARAPAPAPARAPAEPTRVAWSTYLRAGPGQGFAAVDELEHDAAIEVRGCSDAWCQVFDGQVLGYVDKAALTLARAPTPAVPASAPTCVVAGLAGDRGPEPTRFCHPAP